MGIPRAEIKYEILTRLNKTATTKGFYTDDKLNSVIQESLDYLATEMMLADEGWLHKLDYITTQPNQVTIPIPPHMSMICEVRYLTGLTYTPLSYDQQWGQAQWSGQSGVNQYPDRYKIIDNQFYFAPAVGVGGTDFLQVEYLAYPRKLRKDTDVVDGQFDRAQFWYVVYHSCALLAPQLQQGADIWGAPDALWTQRMRDMVGMRTRQTIPVRDFEG